MPPTDFQADLRGRAAIVTGAGAGAGRAIALALAEAGAAVAINDLNPDRAEGTRAAIARAGAAPALACPGDVSNRFQAANLIERARERFGHVSLLVNAAGAGPLQRPLLQLDEWDWRRLLDVNLTGAFFCTQLLGRVMAEEGGGAILNLIPDGLNPGVASGDVATVAARAGLAGLTRQSARELAPLGIRVCGLCVAAAADPAEVAAAALWLCTDADDVCDDPCLRLEDLARGGLRQR